MSNKKQENNDVSIVFTCIFVFISLYLVFSGLMPFWLLFLLPVVGIILDVKFASKKSYKKELSQSENKNHPATLKEEFEKRLDQQKAMLSHARDSKIKEAKLAKTKTCKPIKTFSVSKVGELNDFHCYDTPDEEYVGKEADVNEDIQFNTNFREREVYIVNVDGSDIGEVTNSTAEKLREATDNFCELIYIVASVTETDDPEVPKVKIAAYDIPDSSIVRVWKMPLVGIPYNNRSQRLHACGVGIYGLEITSYEGKPAVMILDPFGKDVGFIPKEHAEEVANYYNEDRITCVRVSKIDPAPHGGLYADLELEILR